MAKKGGWAKAHKPKKGHPWGGMGKKLGPKPRVFTLRLPRPNQSDAVVEDFLSLPELYKELD